MPLTVLPFLVHSRRLLLAALLVLALLGAASAPSADAANITRGTKFSCGTAALTVHFPQLRTTSGTETVNFSPDLYRWTSSGWQLADGSKPWYWTTVKTYGHVTYNGFQWWSGAAWPYSTPWQNTRFTNLSRGYYAIKGYFYGGSSHWAQVYGSTAQYCWVS